jgi:hypothetical protein
MFKLLGLLKLALVLSLLAGCPKKMPPDGPEHVASIIDCSTADARPAIEADIATQKAELLQGKMTWDDVYTKSESWVVAKGKEIGVKIGGCVLAELVQWALGQRGAPMMSQEESWKPHDALKRFRKERANGATFEAVIDGRRVHL